VSTRSMIGIQQEDGKIRAIYCHYDGYPEGVGQTLANYYRTTEQTEALLDLGNLSYLRQELGEKQDFNKRETHNENWSLAYGRDRGETEQEAKLFDYVGEYLEYARNSWAEFAYIFTPKGWAYWNLRTTEPTQIKSALVMS